MTRQTLKIYNMNEKNTLLKEEIIALDALMKRLGYKASLKELVADISQEDELCPKCKHTIHPCVPCEEVIGYTNQVDSEYFRLIDLILEEGKTKKNRTGIDTIGVFGAQAKFDVDLNAFPILTTKKVWFKGIAHELLWFIRGDTNIKYLVDHDVHIWDEWAYKRYVDICKVNAKGWWDDWMRDNKDGTLSMFTQQEFIHHIKENKFHVKGVLFANKWGELGEGTYGGMWRAFPGPMQHSGMGWPSEEVKVDQLKKVVEKLKTNPDDRRMIVSAWHPYYVDHCALPPCHCLFHFNTEELTFDERHYLFIGKMKGTSNVLTHEDFDRVGIPKRRLNCLLYQRSCDTFLGVPFNITSYALLTAMIAHCVDMVPGTFTHTYGDLHIYTNHLSQIDMQKSREPKNLPKLWLNPDVKDLFSFKFDDIKLIGYEPHPAIKGEVAV